MTDYRTFLHRKTQAGPAGGFEPLWLPDWLFPFQRHLCEWSIRQGRAAIFADCGLGKGPMQLVFAENVVRKTGGKFLIIAPLAVAQQFVREGAKFGIDVTLSRDGSSHRLTVTNYECLHKFNPDDFAGAAADESSAIKAFDGRRRKQVVRFFSKLPYRLLCTATPSPNDFIELGTQSECLGVMTQSDMLGYFFRETKDMRHSPFRDDDIHGRIKWWFKPHSEQPFWRWVSSWARAVRKPSDIGFSDDGFVLPKLTYKQHVLQIPFVPKGELFHRPAITLKEQRDERQRTVNERCEKVAELLNVPEPAIAWCHYNQEGDCLERLMPWAIQIAGKNSDEYKEAAVEWFAGYRCLCDDPLFTHKRPAWEQVANESSNICVNGRSGTESASASTAAAPRQKGTRADVNGTHQIQKNGRAKSPKSPCIERSTHTPSLIGSCVSAETAEPTRKSSRHKKADAQSVGTASATVAGINSTSITATHPVAFAGCSAEVATLELANSSTTLSSSNGRPCICGHRSGKRHIITKGKITAWGVNWQCCGLMTFFPTFSFEQFYQGVRRCWRFGRKKPVTVHIVSAEGESRVMDGLSGKQEQAEQMFASLVKYMNDALAMMSDDGHTKAVSLPAWIQNGAA